MQNSHLNLNKCGFVNPKICSISKGVVMYNFDCKGKNIEVKNNEIIEKDMVAIKDIKKLIDLFYEIIKRDTKDSKKYLNSLDHKTLFKEILYLTNAQETLLDLKGRVFDRYVTNGVFSAFECEVNRFFMDILRSISVDRFSYPEKAIIGEYTDGFNGEFSVYQMYSYYDPTNDQVLIEKERQDLLAFDFTDYVPYLKKAERNYEELSNSKKLIEDLGEKTDTVYLEIHDNFNSIYNSTLKEIESFKRIINSAKEDIINWGIHKTSRFINKYKLYGSYALRNWLETYKKHLIKNGIKLKEKRVTRSEKAEQKLQDKRCKVDQEDLIRVFKQGNKVEEAIEKLNLDSLKSLMNSTLKCVSERMEKYLSKIIKRYCAISITEEDYKTIISFLGKFSGWQAVTWEFMVKNQDYITVDDMISFGSTRTCSWGGEGSSKEQYNAPKTFFDKVLTKIPKDKILSMNRGISYEYLKRMSPSQLLEILPSLNSNNVNMENVVKLYVKVDYKSLKKVMVLNKDFLQHATSLIVVNKDKTLAKRCLKEDACHDYEGNNNAALLNLFSYDEKASFIFDDIKKAGSRIYDITFEEALKKAFSTPELLSLLKGIRKLEKTESANMYVQHIFETINDRNLLSNTIKNNLEGFPVTDITIPLLSNEVKIALLKSGVVRLEETDRTNSTFFKTLKRSELQEVEGENLLESKYLLYIAHALTDEEKAIAADKDNAFLRFNLKELKMEYLKKYKDKEAFKACVGNRVYRENKYFARELANKLGIDL